MPPSGVHAVLEVWPWNPACNDRYDQSHPRVECGANCTSYREAPGTGSHLTIGVSVLTGETGLFGRVLPEASTTRRLWIVGATSSNALVKLWPEFQTPASPFALMARTRQ